MKKPEPPPPVIHNDPRNEIAEGIFITDESLAGFDALENGLIPSEKKEKTK